MNNHRAKLIFVSLSLAIIVACGKKSSSNPAPQPPPVMTCVQGQVLPAGQICVNGQITTIDTGHAGNLVNSADAQNSYLAGRFNFTAMGALNMTGIDPELAVYYYSGPVRVYGAIQVANNSLCGAPIGTYMADGTGQIQLGVVTNLTLNVSGPSSMQILVYQGFLMNPAGIRTNASGNRFGIYTAQLMVNGMPCGTITTY